VLAAAVALLVFAAVALAVTPDPGGYIGKTGQDKRVVVRVNDNARIKRFDIDFQAPCEDPGSKWVAGTRIKDGPDHRIEQQNGVFSDYGKYTQKSEDSEGNVFKGHFRVWLEGEFTSRTHAEGKFRVKIRVTHEGETVDHCKKTVRWKVNPQ
jgi:hypothetical protein